MPKDMISFYSQHICSVILLLQGPHILSLSFILKINFSTKDVLQRCCYRVIYYWGILCWWKTFSLTTVDEFSKTHINKHNKNTMRIYFTNTIPCLHCSGDKIKYAWGEGITPFFQRHNIVLFSAFWTVTNSFLVSQHWFQKSTPVFSWAKTTLTRSCGETCFMCILKRESWSSAWRLILDFGNLQNLQHHSI